MPTFHKVQEAKNISSDMQIKQYRYGSMFTLNKICETQTEQIDKFEKNGVQSLGFGLSLSCDRE